MLVSPCDAIVGASGSIVDVELMQVKGFPYTMQDLLRERKDLAILYVGDFLKRNRRPDRHRQCRADPRLPSWINERRSPVRHQSCATTLPMTILPGGGSLASEKHLHRYLAAFAFRYSNRVRLGVDDMERATKIAAGISGKRLAYRWPHEAQL